MKRALLKIIRFYQTAVSPLFPPRCRFIPTCSQYALEAVEKYGALKGGWRSVGFSSAIRSTRAGGTTPCHEAGCLRCFPTIFHIRDTSKRPTEEKQCLHKSDIISVCLSPG